MLHAPWGCHLMLCSWLACVVVCSLRTSPSATQTQAAQAASMRAKAGTLPRAGGGRSGQGWYSSLAQTSIFENLPRTCGRRSALRGRARRQSAACARARRGISDQAMRPNSIAGRRKLRLRLHPETPQLFQLRTRQLKSSHRRATQVSPPAEARARGSRAAGVRCEAEGGVRSIAATARGAPPASDVARLCQLRGAMLGASCWVARHTIAISLGAVRQRVDHAWTVLWHAGIQDRRRVVGRRVLRHLRLRGRQVPLMDFRPR